jgi:type IV pilus assembly protein PilP
MDAVRHRVFVVLALTLLAGCGMGDPYADIEKYMDEVDALQKPAIEPLPEFLPYQAFAYGASDLRSPFDPPVEVKPVDPMRKSPDVKPNFDRVKQYLEQFNMSELAMVGTLAQGSKMYALMRDGRGGVHRVQTGDYMGTDHGKIVAIDESTLEMLEIVSDGAGGWVERERTVSLGGAES